MYDPKTFSYVPPHYATDKTGLSQELIQRVGMWSRCKVSLQQFVVHGGLAAKFRLYCNVCHAYWPFEYEDLRNALRIESVLDKIETFCIQHQMCGEPKTSDSAQIAGQLEGQLAPQIRALPGKWSLDSVRTVRRKIRSVPAGRPVPAVRSDRPEIGSFV